MDELLNLYRDAAGVINEGNFFDTQFQDDLDPTGPLPGQDNESDIDESLIVENDDDVDIDTDEEDTPPPNLEGHDAIIGHWNNVDLDLGLDQNEDLDLVTASRPKTIAFDEPIGPRLDLGVSATSSAFDFFSLFFTPQLLQHIVEQTNIYAQWRQEKDGKEDKYWKPVSAGDIRIYLATQYMMGIHKLPEYSMYWSSDDRLRVAGIAEPMGKSRYEKIHQYFHLNHPEHEAKKGEPGYDPLYKVRPLLNHILARAKQLYYPSQQLSIDEGMIGFRGRLHFKQYMRGKPIPWGIKVWCLADPTNGYLCNFDIYTGKSPTPHPNGLGFKVVTEMGNDYLDKGHHFFFDNFFASVALTRHLLSHNTHSCCTIRTNRTGWPDALKERAISKMKRGEVKCCQDGGLTATVWRDKRKVAVLSTNVTPSMIPVQRRAPGRLIQVITPSPVIVYNKFMFGVDLADQHRSYYGMGRSGLKWWRYVAWFLFQTAMINSWILFKLCNNPAPKNRRQMSQIQFRLDVCTALVAGCKSRKRRATDRLPATIAVAIPDPAEHQPIRLQGLKKGCVECRVQGKKTPAGHCPTTTNGCSLCKVHLCKGVCFATFHQKLMSKINT
ncbi:PiggyBac transposable element-derived protein 4-like [Plakobranchus ocellatus]|uniref:PiggyBac transposable element-derived protein 4-like n=1 Tax=Plakobranchus ocellatus TaxID=259542 RepID=A0AAV4AKW5_9GAST|nr:PiggyBac transposable element-derived protein 4-like [Plakobranchus ocellatus]